MVSLALKWPQHVQTLDMLTIKPRQHAAHRGSERVDRPARD